MIDILTKKHHNSGFTLLEIIISLSLITIAFLAVMRLQAQNLDLQAEAQFITIANYLAQDRLSRIQSRDKPEIGPSSGDFSPAFPNFRYREEIEEVTDIDYLIRVKVTIILDAKESTKELPIITYLYRHKT